MNPGRYPGKFGDAARPARRVVCGEDIKIQLLEIARSRKQQSGLSLRVKIILQSG